MTVLSSTDYRGHFDPISLGLHAPTDLDEITKPKDGFSWRDKATFVHELSHYLQFYGTVFGYSYLFLARGLSLSIEHVIHTMRNRHDLMFPVAEWEFNQGEVFVTPEDRRIHLGAICSNRYYNEELYGFTYAHCGDFKPVRMAGHLVFSSPLFLMLPDGSHFGFTGETLLENYAAFQEAQFLACYAPADYYLRHGENTYLSLPGDLAAKYMGLQVWIASFKLLHIEPYLYFTLLNQPQSGLPSRLGEYALGRNTKKLLDQYPELQQLSRPQSNDEARLLIENIAELSGLDNPLDTLSATVDMLAKSVSKKTWSVDYISSSIMSWFLNEPLQIAAWPTNIDAVLHSIPIVKVHYDGQPQGMSTSFVNPDRNIPSERASLIRGHHQYAERTYILHGLFSKAHIRCPYMWKTLPHLCSSCNSCSGFLPDSNVAEDCPVLRKHGDLLCKSATTQEETNQ